MNNETILAGIIGLLLGVIIATFGVTYAVNKDHNGMMSQMMSMHSGSSMSMDQMVAGLQGKTSDDFDKIFISQMIDHHQGAIDMANLAKQNAKHDEIKKLADDIVIAQTKEINQMKTWQQLWGYSSSSDSSDDTMNMMGD